nr:hypothetical protein [Sedimentibacter sp.]
MKLYEINKTVLAHLAKRLCAFVLLIEVTISKILAGKIKFYITTTTGKKM